MQQHDIYRSKEAGLFCLYKRPMAMPIKVFIKFIMCLLKIAACKT
jgi:hypothetical protein